MTETTTTRWRIASVHLATIMLVALLAAVWPPPDALARECLDYPSYGGPHGDPPLAGALVLADDALDVAVQVGHAYLACGAAGLQVVELSVPTSPVWVGEADLQGDAVTVAVSGVFAYVGVGTAVKIVDVTLAAFPEWVQTHIAQGLVRDIHVAGGLALAAVDTAGLLIIEADGDALLKNVAGVTTAGASRAATATPDGATAWVATTAGVEIVALDGPAPELLATLVIGCGARALALAGDVLWVASDDGRLLACDVTDPRVPFELRRHTLPAPARDLRLDDGFAYMVGDDGLTRVAGAGSRGVYVPLGTLPTPGQAQRVSGFGPYVVLADGAAGLTLGWRQCDLMLAVGRDPDPRPRLLGNVPNPLNPGTTVLFSLEAPAAVRISLHDARGRLAATLLDESMSAGPHRVGWDGRLADGSRAASGVWYVRMEAAGRVATSSLTLLR